MQPWKVNFILQNDDWEVLHPFSDLNESNVRLKLTIVDSTGFGDQINKENR